MKNKKKLSLGKRALILEVCAIFACILLLLSTSMPYVPFLRGFLVILSTLYLLSAPIAGIVVGITALTQKESRSDYICAILAIIIPFLTTLTIILLFSTGALVIRFM